MVEMTFQNSSNNNYKTMTKVTNKPFFLNGRAMKSFQTLPTAPEAVGALEDIS